MIRQGGGKAMNLIAAGATEIVPLHVAGASNSATAVILTHGVLFGMICLTYEAQKSKGKSEIPKELEANRKETRNG
jgi:hypothetical protein